MPEKWETLVLRDVLNPNLFILQTFGYWPPENRSPFLTNLYIAYGVFAVGFFFMLQYFSELINIALSLDDMETVIEATFIFLTHFSQFVKNYHWISKCARIRNLANSLQGPNFRARNERQYKMLKQAMFEGKFMFYLFFCLAMCTCTLWGVFPLTDANEEVPIRLPLSGYFPFDTDPSPVFELCYLHQYIAVTINGITDVAVDTTASSFMSIVSGELCVLNDTLEHIRDFAVERLGERGVELDVDDDEMVHPELEEEMHTILLECVHQHWQILDTTKEIGELFHINVLSQFFSGCVIICLTMFKMTIVDIMSIQFCSMISYQGCMLVEIILYCWFGNEIILRSEKICYSAYCSDWMRNSEQYKKKLMEVMTRAQVPIVLYAGNVFSLSVASFSAIIRTSWSYFMVLRRVNE